MISTLITLLSLLGATALPTQRWANSVANTSQLQTWWHETGVVNTKTAVGDDEVRQSRAYTIQVATDDGHYYDSFAYESIPRSGNGQRLSPSNDTTGGNVDGVSVEPCEGINMAWSQFLYSTDVYVKISRSKPADPSQVVIRPTTLDLDVSSHGNDIVVKVPYSARGMRFSVEFQDDLWEYRPGTTEQAPDGLFVQDNDPSCHNYVSSYNASNPVVGVEPINALLIFASAFPSDELVPSKEDSYVVPQGAIQDLSNVTQSTIYFGPGVYWAGGADRYNLPESVSWVYLAPGAYVKGAIEYTSTEDIKATGYGVLSGEQYVYQANAADDYINNKSDATSLRMWGGTNSSETSQTWTVVGPTINAPPFNTMDFDSHPTSYVSDYKQVGAFFWQTDGMEVYPGSVFSDIFYHIGDDGIKTYYSDVTVERLTVWKTTNDPIVQMGWSPRNVTNVTLRDINVIHTRYPAPNMVVPTALIGASPSYTNIGATNTADLNSRISNFTVTNLRCEGLCPALLRINPLENFDTFLIQNVTIDQYAPLGIGESQFVGFTNSQNQSVQLGGESPNGLGLVIRDFYVNGTHILLSENNWQSNEAGMMDIDGSYWGHWTIE